MTKETKRLLEQLEEHANQYRGDMPCLYLSTSSAYKDKHGGIVNLRVYPSDIFQLCEEVKKLSGQ